MRGSSEIWQLFTQTDWKSWTKVIGQLIRQSAGSSFSVSGCFRSVRASISGWNVKARSIYLPLTHFLVIDSWLNEWLDKLLMCWSQMALLCLCVCVCVFAVLFFVSTKAKGGSLLGWGRKGTQTHLSLSFLSWAQYFTSLSLFLCFPYSHTHARVISPGLFQGFRCPHATCDFVCEAKIK